MNIAPLLKIDSDLLLRKPEKRDIETRFSYGRSLEFRKMVGGSMNNIPDYSYSHAEGLIERELNNKYSWFIEFQGKMIGVVRLRLKSNELARYSIGIYNDKLYSKGIGTKVTNRIIQFAKEELKLNELELMVLEYNKRAIRCYEKCGFVKTKTLKDNIEIDSVTYNDIIMTLLLNENRT